MPDCPLLVLFCLPQKGTKKGHKLAITAANLIARRSFCTTVSPGFRSLSTGRSILVFLGEATPYIEHITLSWYSITGKEYSKA